MVLNPAHAWIRQLAALTLFLLVWEAAGRADLLNPLYVPSPSRIAGALIEIFASSALSYFICKTGQLKLKRKFASAEGRAFCGSGQPTMNRSG